MKNIINNIPTIFHVTHWKSGSQWIKAAFTNLIPKRVVEPEVGQGQFVKSKIIEGAFYPTIYLPKERFDLVKVPENNIKFIIVRDLRDTLISLYFSMKYSHPLIADYVKNMRETLNSLNLEDGLEFLIPHIKDHAWIQNSWHKTDNLFITYEDLVENEEENFMRIFNHCKIDLPEKKLLNAIEVSSFKSKSKGRQLGDEDIYHHCRKGIPGDWKNYFNESLKKAFKSEYGDLLVKIGYEKDNSW